MNKYWNLSEKERSVLTEQQVEAFIQVELMEQGVIAPKPPEMLPLDEIEPAKEVLYQICINDFITPPLLCKSADTLQRLIDAGEFFTLEHDWRSDSQYYVAAKTLSVKSISVMPEVEFTRLRSVIENNATKKKVNEANRKSFEEACKAAQEASKGVWNDYWEMGERSHLMDSIKARYEEYVGLCDGRNDLALAFLKKAHSPEDVAACFEWHKMEMPVVEGATS